MSFYQSCLLKWYYSLLHSWTQACHLQVRTFPSVFADTLARDVVTALTMTRVTVTRVGAADTKAALTW